MRKVNLIVYLSSAITASDGGYLGLWSATESGQIGELVKEVEPQFNRAVVFDTASISWHGLSRQVADRSGVYRLSLATYYLMSASPSREGATRERALFAPRPEQRGDDSIQRLIRRRADSATASDSWRVSE